MNNTHAIKWQKRIGVFIILSMSMVLSLNAAPTKIMMLGDSITSGTGPKPDFPDQNLSTYVSDTNSSDTDAYIAFVDQIAYRGQLWLKLKEAGYTFGAGDNDLDFVGLNTKNSSTFGDENPGFDEDHEGYGGITSGDLLNGKINDAGNPEGNMTRILEANIPDIVLLHIGTNDGAQGIPMSDTVSNVEGILNKIFESNPDAKVFVARIIEARRAHYNAGNWITNDLNNLVKEMIDAHSKNANIKMVDLNSGAGMIYDPCGTELGDMQPYHDTGTIPDNIFEILDFHPNVNGYEKLATKWAADIIDSGWLTDVTPPVIALIEGDKTIQVGESYEDAGATATDNKDKDITDYIVVDTSAVDTNTEGNYTVTYDVNDSAGNQAEQVTRNVEVVAQVEDTTPPEIVLNGASTMTLTVGEPFTDPGATASDNVDGNITEHISVSGVVNEDAAGEYTITYTVKDAAGNEATITRVVTVENAPVPVVTDPSWLNYEENNNIYTATITPEGSTTQSTLKVNGLTAVKTGNADNVLLYHAFGENKAYVTSNNLAEVTTGFNTDDSTLKSGTTFNAGTTAEISKLEDKVIITINTTLNKDQFMTVGGN